MDFKLELVMLPVSDVDRAKDFYTATLGFKLELDGGANEGARNVQVTPPGSACSVGFGSNLRLRSGPLVTAAPGSQRGLHLAVTDIVAARDELIGRGVEVGEIVHMEDGRWQPGADPGEAATCRSRSSAIRTAISGSCRRSDMRTLRPSLSSQAQLIDTASKLQDNGVSFIDSW